MATDFVGTNTDKIDKLVAATIELRTTMCICLRICFAMLGVGFPLMVGLLTFLVVQSFSSAAKVDRLYDQMVILKTDVDKLSDRVDKLSDRVDKLSDRVDKLSERITKLERIGK